jgi:hypothetical protein
MRLVQRRKNYPRNLCFIFKRGCHRDAKNYPHNWFHFFDEIEIIKQCSKLVSFFNELEIKISCSKMVSFFNELEIKKSCSTLVSFFNELEIRKSCSTLFLIMASKRTILWKDTMSRDKTQSWLPIDLHLMEETHSRRNTCRGSREG